MILKQALSLIAIAAMAVCSQSQAQLVEIYSDNFDDETNTGWTYLDRSAGTALAPEIGGGPGSPSFSETGGVLQQTAENYSFPVDANNQPMLGGIALSAAGVVGDEASAIYRISVQFDSLEESNAFQDHTVVFAYVDEDNYIGVEALNQNNPTVRWYQVIDGVRFTRAGVMITFTQDPFNMVIDVDTLAGTLNIDYNDGETIADISGPALTAGDITIPAGQIGVGSNNDAFTVDNFVVEAMAAGVPLIGDFEPDGDVDIDDIDFYVGNIGAAADGDLAQLDLDGDQMITLTDRQMHIETYVQTSNGQTGTFLGDVNLDGQVNVLGDALALVTNLGGAATSYAQGDINFDGAVNVLGDALILVTNLGLSNDQ